MAICDWCEKEMMDDAVITCAGDSKVEFPDGTILESVPLGSDRATPDGRCHDCNIETGGAHHPGCDGERCPRCSGQLISCGCLDDASEDDDYGDPIGGYTSCLPCNGSGCDRCMPHLYPLDH